MASAKSTKAKAKADIGPKVREPKLKLPKRVYIAAYQEGTVSLNLESYSSRERLHNCAAPGDRLGVYELVKEIPNKRG